MSLSCHVLLHAKACSVEKNNVAECPSASLSPASSFMNWLCPSVHACKMRMNVRWESRANAADHSHLPPGPHHSPATYHLTPFTLLLLIPQLHYCSTILDRCLLSICFDIFCITILILVVIVFLILQRRIVKESSYSGVVHFLHTGDTCDSIVCQCTCTIFNLSLVVMCLL